MQVHTPSQQLASMQARLTQLYIERDNLERRQKALTEEIEAIRNILAGAQLGQQVAGESAQAPATEPASPE